MNDIDRLRAPAAVKEVNDEAGTKGLEARFAVGVAPKLLLEVLWDVGNFGRLYPDIQESHLISQTGDVARVSYKISAVIKTVSYELERTLDRAAGTITWREVGGELKRVRGSWALSGSAGPKGSATVPVEASEIVYRAFVDIGRFVPTSVVRDAAIRKLGDMVARVREEAPKLAEKYRDRA